MNGRIKKKQWKRTSTYPWDEWDGDELLRPLYGTQQEFEETVAMIKSANRGHVTICGRRIPCKKCGRNACGAYLYDVHDDRLTALCKKCAGPQAPTTPETLEADRELAMVGDIVAAGIAARCLFDLFED